MRLSLLAFGLATTAAYLPAATMYSITDLGTLGGATFTTANSVNNAGQVAGTSGDSAFLWQNGTLTGLGTLGGRFSDGLALNSNGWITGLSETAGGEFHAFLWDGTTMRDLGTLGGGFSMGQGVNSTGQVAGWSSEPGGLQWGFRWNGTTMEALDVPGGFSYGYAINDAGQVGGERSGRATIWTGSTAQDLGLVGIVRAVNNNGQAAGHNLATGTPFFWNGSSLVFFQSAAGERFVYGMNDAGHVVGSSLPVPGGGLKAFLWDGTQTYNLNDYLVNGAGWVLTGARDVNELGQIVGSGTFNGETRGFLLTPVGSAVPEPSTWLGGLAALLVLLKRRAR